MWLYLLLIRALMCDIKYIAMFQLENTGNIHHFNWYPPPATWMYQNPASPKWSLHAERQGGFFFFFYWTALIELMLCVSADGCIDLDLCILRAIRFLRPAVRLLIINLASPMIPLLSVYWMEMQMKSSPRILFRQSHLISHCMAQPGNVRIFDWGLMSESNLNSWNRKCEGNKFLKMLQNKMERLY